MAIRLVLERQNILPEQLIRVASSEEDVSNWVVVANDVVAIGATTVFVTAADLLG